MIKNWRGLEIHTVDDWDHWSMSLEKYYEMKATYDLVSHQIFGDMELVHKLIEFAVQAKVTDQAEYDAGIDI